MKESWIEIITIALGSSGLTGYLTYRLSSRKQDNNEFVSIVNEYKEMLVEWKLEKKELQDEAKSLRRKIEQLEKSEIELKLEVISLRNQLMIFEGSHGDVPVPIWLKDTKGVMLFLNDEYEKVVLHPLGKTKKDYIGKTDYEFWTSVFGKEKGAEIAKEFRGNDLDVQKGKRPSNIKETWKVDSEMTYVGNIVKYPRFSYTGSNNNRIVIGIGGIILNIKEVKTS
jgi:hypothetical protein